MQNENPYFYILQCPACGTLNIFFLGFFFFFFPNFFYISSLDAHSYEAISWVQLKGLAITGWKKAKILLTMNILNSWFLFEFHIPIKLLLNVASEFNKKYHWKMEGVCMCMKHSA